MKAFRTPIAAITDNVFLCGCGCITETNLQARGITHVLNTAYELENFKYPLADILEVKHILMHDSPEEDLTRYLDQCVDHIQSIVNQNGRILVHCVAGVSRSASVCIAFLVKYRQKSLKQAYDHVFSKRSCIFPNFNFWQHLTEFEVKITGTSTVEMLPTVMGMVPTIMRRDAEYRIKMAWMGDLISMFSVHLIILIVQLLSLHFFANP